MSIGTLKTCIDLDIPIGLSLQRSFDELPGVPLKDEVWPKFLRENTMRVLKLEEGA